MVLDTKGGPTYINFTADAPIIISDDGNEFYKQPMFYGLGHFSKFIIPGSKRINVVEKCGISGKTNIRFVAFLRPDKLKAIVVFNK